MSTPQAKHTPGPWWVTDSGVRDAGGYICHTNEAQHYQGQDERYELETAERAANKRLIAAAPDLLNALQMLHDDIADYIRLNNIGGMDNHCMKLARAAIDKATEPA